MKKILSLLIIVLLLIALCVVGIYYSQKKNTEVFQEPASMSSPTPTPIISLPPKDVQQKVITQDEKSHKALTLTVTSPVDKSTVTKATLVVKGKTSPKAEVFVNDSEGVADANGNFSLNITLDEGDNPVIVMANDAAGNAAEQDLNITYNAGQ
jgi:cytoskeletal protein RodZ